jgi:hypothetical protein
VPIESTIGTVIGTAIGTAIGEIEKREEPEEHLTWA